jgi:CBS-domain-containing membrane protein
MNNLNPGDVVVFKTNIVQESNGVVRKEMISDAKYKHNVKRIANAQDTARIVGIISDEDVSVEFLSAPNRRYTVRSNWLELAIEEDLEVPLD